MITKLFLPLFAFVGLPAAHMYAQSIEVTATGVGIGTLTPDNSKLHVAGGHINVDDGFAIAWGGGTGRPAVLGNKAAGVLSFHFNSTERMRIDSIGNVGIGTTTPFGKLAVVGSISSGSAASAGVGTNLSTLQTTSTSAHLYLARSVATWGDTWWEWTHDTGNKLKLGFSTVPQAEFSNGLAVFLGNVGIGTTSPSQRLEVAGSVRATSFIANANTYADFVFKPDYKLRSLSEVEASIKAHGHLPDIPSEAEAKARGIDLAAMQVKLLQKVEELTLYLVEHDKELKLLRAENAALRQQYSESHRQPAKNSP